MDVSCQYAIDRHGRFCCQLPNLELREELSLEEKVAEKNSASNQTLVASVGTSRVSLSIQGVVFLYWTRSFEKVI